VYVVTPGYLRAMGTRLHGRDFTWDDGPKSENVIMINKSYANFMAGYANWPNGDAVGQVLENGKQVMRVVGVADDVHEESTEGEAGWQIYYPATQADPTGAQLVVRTTLPPATLANSVLRTLRELNPNQPAAEFKPIKRLVERANSGREFFMMLVGAFAGLGLLLAALGIYGLISYSVTRRTQEIGIRMALGASGRRVLADVMGGTLRLAIWGIALGTATSLALTRIITSMLFETPPWDVSTYVAVVFVLFVVAAVSGYIPAFRASRMDAMVALRTD
jgi:ABC-type antimicrobial peptide transport system permease subunit